MTDAERLAAAGFTPVAGGHALAWAGSRRHFPAWRNMDGSLVIKTAPGDWRLYIYGGFRARYFVRCSAALAYYRRRRTWPDLTR